MFETPLVPCFLQSVAGLGEADRKELRLTLYLNPLTADLAEEISPQLHEALFHKVGVDYLPRLEMPKASFELGIENQNVSFFPHNGEAIAAPGVMVQGVKISKVQARRAFPDKPEFRLEFDATVSMDDVTMTLVRKYFLKTVFLTMQRAQPELALKDPVLDLRCRLCDAPNPEFATTDSKFAYCEKDSANIQEGEKLRRIRDIAKAAAVSREPGDEEDEPKKKPRKDPLAQDFNARNRQGRRRRQ